MKRGHSSLSRPGQLVPKWHQKHYSGHYRCGCTAKPQALVDFRMRCPRHGRNLLSVKSGYLQQGPHEFDETTTTSVNISYLRKTRIKSVEISIVSHERLSALIEAGYGKMKNRLVQELIDREYERMLIERAAAQRVAQLEAQATL